MELYPLLRLVHILSATLLFGTGLGSAFYLWQAHRSGDVAVIAGVSRNVVLADWLFTTPAVVIQPLSGVWMMLLLGYGMDLFWLHWSVVLYLLAGVCWLPVVWLQIKMRRMSRDALAAGTALPATYYRYMRIWFFLGWPAFLAVLGAFYLMVLKPV
jgi:uncharacterized membrane protein